VEAIEEEPQGGTEEEVEETDPVETYRR